MSICFSCWLRCLRCAKRCSLLRGCLLRSARLWILIGVLRRSFNGKSSSARICRHLLCLQFCVIWMGNCSWFTDGKHCFTDDESTQQPLMNNTWKCALVIGGKVYVAWKRKMLHDVIGGHQAYIHEKIDLWRIKFCSWLRPRAVNRLRDEIIKSLALSLGTTYKQRERFNLKWLLQGYHKIYD